MFPLKDNKREGNVTISLGSDAIRSREELAPEKLIKKADAALYVSKRNGSNQVSFGR